jgi:viral A-type inclusion protein, putative
MADNKLDITNMIERSYNILSNFENKIQAFFESYKNVDTKIVTKETAFLNAKKELELFMQEYKQILETTKEEFKIELVKEQKQFIEIANANTKEVLNARKEELTEIMEQEKQKVLLKTEKVITILESFQDNINSKIADILKDLPSASEDYINNVILDVKKIGSTLKNDVEEYKKLSLEEVNSCKDTLKQSTKAIKEVAEDIKAENSNIIKNRNNLEADYKKVNSSLEKVSKDINNLIKGINNVKYTFLINKIYILLFSLLNSLFILRIIVPQQWKFNFYGKKTLWTLIIVASLLIVVGIGDFIYRTILPILSNLFTSEEEADED